MSESKNHNFEPTPPSEEGVISIADARASLSRVATSAEVNWLLAKKWRDIATDPTVSHEERKEATKEYEKMAETIRIQAQTLQAVEEDMGLNRVD